MWLFNSGWGEVIRCYSGGRGLLAFWVVSLLALYRRFGCSLLALQVCHAGLGAWGVRLWEWSSVAGLRSSGVGATGLRAAAGRVCAGARLQGLLIPVVVRRLLTSLVKAISAVVIDGMNSTTVSTISLMSSVGVLIVRTLSTLTTNNTVLYSRCLKDRGAGNTHRTTERMFFIVTFLSMLLSTFYLVAEGSLLHTVFNTIRTSMVEGSRICFFFALLSFPFVNLCSTNTSVVHTRGGDHGPVIVSIVSGFVGVNNGAVLVFNFNVNIRKTTVSALMSQVFYTVIIVVRLQERGRPVFVGGCVSVHPR